MKRFSTLLAAIALSVAPGYLVMTPPASAVRLSDGKVYFVQPPRLLGAWTTQNSIYVWGATYYFTLNLAENAGEPLGQITIAQQTSPDNVRYYPNDTFAFEGTRRQRGAALKIAETIEDRENRSLTIRFDPPIPPGKTITIGLRPVRNPSTSGVYLFGVTAFPQGDNPHGQFLGFGRLQFYDGRDNSFLYRRSPFFH